MRFYTLISIFLLLSACDPFDCRLTFINDSQEEVNVEIFDSINFETEKMDFLKRNLYFVKANSDQTLCKIG